MNKYTKELSFEIGKKYSIHIHKTYSMYHVGKVKSVTDKEIVLEQDFSPSVNRSYDKILKSIELKESRKPDMIPIINDVIIDVSSVIDYKVMNK